MSTQQSNAIQLSDTVEIPWNLLRKGAANVRVVSPEKADDAALIANIGETGVILENLIVTPNEDGTYGVHAGGRRWSAIGANVKSGVLDETFPVPCRVQESGSLTAVSLAENLQAAMHPIDECSAMQDMLKEGMDQEAIALHFGLPKQRVAQRLKLAQVAPCILKAYRKGDVDLQTVMAFTLADSKKRQVEVFKELGNHCHAHMVKRALTGEAERSDGRLAKFVGVAAYQKAGGTVINDMFSDYDHLPDRELLEALAQAKLDASAERLKKKEGWANTTILSDSYFPSHEYHRIEPEPVGVPEDLTKRLEKAIADQNALEESDGDWTDESEAEFDALTETIGELESEIDGFREYSDSDKERATCFLYVTHGGKLEIARGYVTRAQARKQSKASGEGKAEVSTGMPNALVQDLGVHRRQIAKAALIGDPALASDILLYTLCSQVLNPYSYESRTIDARFDVVEPTDEAHQETVAGQALSKARNQLFTEWMDIEDSGERFAALRKLTPKRKQTLLTYCVSALFTAGAYDESNTLVEAVLDDLSPDYAASWRPTGEGFFKRVTRDTLLTLGGDLFGEDWTSQHGSAKKGGLVATFDTFFNGRMPSDITDEEKAIRETWLPSTFQQEDEA
ncbi:MAG: ParB N-terminal domain-containing protein [Pseudomonadota bacterium]